MSLGKAAQRYIHLFKPLSESGQNLEKKADIF